MFPFIIPFALSLGTYVIDANLLSMAIRFSRLFLSRPTLLMEIVTALNRVIFIVFSKFTSQAAFIFVKVLRYSLFFRAVDPAP